MPLTLRNACDTRPRIEYYPINSSTLRTVIVEEYPFIIGRGEHTQLQIKLSRVSREHAKLTRSPMGFLLEDLQSTNGTEVNGKLITEALLEDGDSIRIAETELTFRCSSRPKIERMETQPIERGRKPELSVAAPSGVAIQRELSEALLWQMIPLSFAHVVDDHSKVQRATFVSIAEPLATKLGDFHTVDACSVVSRIQQLAWMLAAEEAAKISSARSVYLRVQLLSGVDNRLCDSLDTALEYMADGRQLGVLLPWEWAMQSPATIQVCRELKELGAELAFDDFSGGATCIDAMEQSPPDLIVFSPKVTRGISSQPRRKKHLETVAARCKELNTQAVMPAGLEKDDYLAGGDLGLSLTLSSLSSHTDARCPNALASIG